MKTVFLSGSRKLGRLNPRVRERIDNIVTQGFQIVVGDANGADRAMQAYLRDIGYEHVTIYCSGGRCRNNLGPWQIKTVEVPAHIQGRNFYSVKDRAMADQADFGFVLWDGRSAGTVANVLELLSRSKKVLLFFSPHNDFYKISSASDLRSVLADCAAKEIDVIDKKIGLSGALKRLDGGPQVQLGL